MVLHWALQGTLKGPFDFRDSARLFLPFLMDPKIDPVRLILEDPCRLKALHGPSKVQIDKKNYRPQDNGQTFDHVIYS